MEPWVVAPTTPLTVRALPLGWQLIPTVPTTKGQPRSSWPHSCTGLTGCALPLPATSSEKEAELAELPGDRAGQGHAAPQPVQVQQPQPLRCLLLLFNRYICQGLSWSLLT